MDIHILKETDKELEIEILNEKPTILMLLKEELDKREEVVLSAWREEHPMLKKVRFIIVTDGTKTPREVLLDVIQSAIKRVDEFSKAIKGLKLK